MSGVFLSYSRADRSLAEQVIRALRSLGVDVWWDEDMPGVDWQEELGRQINELAAVIVLWTPASVSSKNVRDEARLGQHTEKLVNALLGVSSPPFPFDRVNGLPLDGWNGVDPHGGWSRLVQTVEDHLAQTGAVEHGALSGALARREQEVRTGRRAIAEAEELFRSAKADEEVAGDGYAAAHEALQAAQAQMRRIMEMEGSPAIVRAAQSDLDAALRAKDMAEAERKRAAVALSAASRNLTTAKAALSRMLGDAVPPSPADSVLPRLRTGGAGDDRSGSSSTTRPDRDVAKDRQDRELTAPLLVDSEGPQTSTSGTSHSARSTAASLRHDFDDPGPDHPESQNRSAAPDDAARLEDVPTRRATEASRRQPSRWFREAALLSLVVFFVCFAVFYFNYTFTVSNPANDPRVNWLVGNWGPISSGSVCKDNEYEADSIVGNNVVGKLAGGETIARYYNVVPRVRLWDGAVMIDSSAETRSSDGNTIYDNGRPAMVRCSNLPAEPVVNGAPPNP